MKENIRQNVPYEYNKFYIDREESHKCFGGVIYTSDFDNCWGGGISKPRAESDWARRIAADHRFDMLCGAGKINDYSFKKEK